MRQPLPPGFPRRVARAVAGVAAGLAIYAAAGAAHACKDEAIKRLGALGVAATSITDVWVYRESTQEGGFQGYKAWASLKGCTGYAIVDMDARCHPFQQYTTKDCRIPGVANY